MYKPGKILVVVFIISILWPLSLFAQPHDTTTVRQMEQVVVTGQYAEQQVSKSVYKITVIDKKTIDAKAPVNVQQILNTELGIRFNNDMALGTSNISVMGMDGRGVKILLDGVPVTDRGDIRESLNQINVATVARIELVEGPMSTLYGSDALAGLINIITIKPAKGLRLQAKIHEETAGNEYRPFGVYGLHTQDISGSWSNNKWQLTGYLMHYNFNGYGADSLKRNHSWKPKAQWMPGIKIGYTSKWGNIYYHNDYLNEKIVTKGAINTSNYKALNQWFVTNKMSHQVQAMYQPAARLLFNGMLSYSDYERHTTTDIIDYTTHTATPSRDKGAQDTAKFETMQLRITGTHYTLKNLTIQPGIEINHEAARGARITGTPQITNYSLFVSANYQPWQQLSILPALRLNKNSLYKAPPAIPSFNMKYIISSSLTLRAGYARGYRAPALRELYFDFVDANHNLKGNPHLKAEHSNNFSLYVMYKPPSISPFLLESGIFYNRYKNLITLGVNPQDATSYIMLNIDQNRTCGLSLKGAWEGKRLRASLGGLMLAQYNNILQQADIDDTGIPHYNWSPEVNASLTYTISTWKTNLNIFYKYTGRRSIYQAYYDAAGALKTSLGRIAAYHFGEINVQQPVNALLAVQAGVKNIFNTTNIASTSTGNASPHSNTGAAIPLSYGRSYFLTLQFNYFKNKF